VLAGSQAAEDPCEKVKQTITADRVWGGPDQMNAPRAVSVAPDGSIYVADSRNHRILKYDADGTLVLTWGSFGDARAGTAAPGTFNEPWGVAVGPDGSVYVADTWNHRLQKFDANGQFLTLWGHEQYQPDNFETFDGFWGPRAVVVDQAGRVFVADTGNKRIVVFDENGQGLSNIGGSGFEPGLLDEPVGLAFGPDGTVYVADTWNQRVQAFKPDPSTGEYLFAQQWPVVGWYGQSLDNKPYLAVDAQGRVYATDPEGYRVLVFNKDGQCLATWGDFGADNTAFALASGIAVDAQGNVYVTDAVKDDQANDRVMKFPPLK